MRKVHEKELEGTEGIPLYVRFFCRPRNSSNLERVCSLKQEARFFPREIRLKQVSRFADGVACLSEATSNFYVPGVEMLHFNSNKRNATGIIEFSPIMELLGREREISTSVYIVTFLLHETRP